MISIGLFSFHWKMALATLWVIPVSLVVFLFTRKFQRTLSETALSQRLDYDQKITECIENIKDIKENNRKMAHKEELSIKLDKREKHAFMSELGLGLPVAFAQIIFKIRDGSRNVTRNSTLILAKYRFFHFSCLYDHSYSYF